jgi:hypothetical protein
MGPAKDLFELSVNSSGKRMDQTIRKAGEMGNAFDVFISFKYYNLL